MPSGGEEDDEEWAAMRAPFSTHFPGLAPPPAPAAYPGELDWSQIAATTTSASSAPASRCAATDRLDARPTSPTRCPSRRRAPRGPRSAQLVLMSR